VSLKAEGRKDFRRSSEKRVNGSRPSSERVAPGFGSQPSDFGFRSDPRRVVNFQDWQDMNSCPKVAVGTSIMRLAMFVLGCGFAVVSAIAAPVDYLREIKPVLAENCYRCHGASQQKHSLRLDTAAAALKGGESGPAIQPGQSGRSLLVQAIKGEHDSLSRMPYKKPPLSDDKISLVARWIDEGAKAPADEEPEKNIHWSFVAPARPPVPQLVNRKSEIVNQIDAFVLARLATDNLKPSPEADRVTLIRRVSLDLTGLPPTIAEVDAFVNDRSPDAYGKVVERLLASPHHGERWGRHWLDVARYADSNGYSIDAPRSIWKYRDWVINALNRDMPFDQFTIWQIAGDLIDTNTLAPRTSPDETADRGPSRLAARGTPNDPGNLRASPSDHAAATGDRSRSGTVVQGPDARSKLEVETLLEPLIATGFNRNTQINQEGGIDPEQFRVESVMDRVNTTATAWLGVTLACAQCHDHKFDPFTQKEYYQFYAFFNSTIEDGHGKGAPDGMLEIPGELEAGETLKKELEEAEADLDRYLDTRGSEVVKWEQALTPDDEKKLKPDVKKALKVEFARRTRKQKRIVYAAFQPDDAEFKQRNAKLTKLERNQPKPVTTLVMRELPKPRETRVFTKGDFTRPAAVVQPGVPAILQPPNVGQASSLSRTSNSQSNADDPARTNAVAGSGTDSMPVLGTRLDLARWLVNTNNPLTARVIVNRIWQQYFGRGLVETENDFGTQGSPPSHPDLLDWLACELMAPERRDGANGSASPGTADEVSAKNTGAPGRGENGTKSSRSADQPRPSRLSPSPWSLKHLHRLIVTSATYRQSSKARPDLAIIDPNNKLLARQNRLRLDAEIVRDVALTASGLLNPKIGGPSVFPPQPDGVMNLGQSRREWKPSTGPDRYRRGMYTFFWRATPHPSLMVFDSADGFSTCTRRLRSNTPLQALNVLNDEAYFEFAQALAVRILKEGPRTDAARVEFAFRLCLARSPKLDEKQRLLDLLNQERAAFDASPTDANAIVGTQLDPKIDRRQLAAWIATARVLLNLDETITRE
jgi:mono/diheme cytochrome c family protein